MGAVPHAEEPRHGAGRGSRRTDGTFPVAHSGAGRSGRPEPCAAGGGGRRDGGRSLLSAGPFQPTGDRSHDGRVAKDGEERSEIPGRDLPGILRTRRSSLAGSSEQFCLAIIPETGNRFFAPPTAHSLKANSVWFDPSQLSSAREKTWEFGQGFETGELPLGGTCLSGPLFSMLDKQFHFIGHDRRAPPNRSLPEGPACQVRAQLRCGLNLQNLRLYFMKTKC